MKAVKGGSIIVICLFLATCTPVVSAQQPPEALEGVKNLQIWFVEAFTVRAFFIIGLYHLIIFILRPKDKAPLFFALLCWAAMVRIGVAIQSTSLFQLPINNTGLALRIEYLIIFLFPLFFVLFVRSLYPKDIHRWFIWAVFLLAIVFSLFTVFAEPLTLRYAATIYQIVFVLEIIYYLFFLGWIIRKRREGAFYIALASLILFAGIIIDTLYRQNIAGPLFLYRLLPVGQFMAYSFLVFIFLQAILLASRFSKSFQRVETLSVELEEVNLSLHQSERKYRIIFEDSNDMIFTAGLDSQIEDVSPACGEVLGYTREELLGMNLQDVIVQSAIRSQFQNLIYHQGAVKNFEVEFERKDGQKVDGLINAALRYDENGEVIGVQGSVRDITARKQAEAERLRAIKLEQIAITDPLTKVYSRRFFYEITEKEIERAQRSSSPLSVILFDIDNFKKVNDTYGHLIGDQVLFNLADFCQLNIRSMDVFARFGGEEFIILMPDTDSKSAQDAAERLREMVAKKVMATSGEIEVTVTISLGIATWNHNSPIEIDTLLDQADRALYQAKEAGRNRIVLWGK